MKNQTGARWLKMERRRNMDKEPVCVQHHKSEEESVLVRPGVRKRVRRV